MGRGKTITNVERGEVKVLVDLGLTERQIAEKLGRSKTLVHDCIARGVDNRPGVSCGRKRKLTDREERRVQRAASNTPISAIASDLGLEVSRSTIIRTLHRSEHLVPSHLKVRPHLSAANVRDREAFAESHVQWRDEWKRVIFSDEEMFTLDGPDDNSDGVKVWLGFSYDF